MVLVKKLEIETTQNFDKEVNKLSKKTLPNLKRDVENLIKSVKVKNFEEVKRDYDLRKFQNMPRTDKFYGYKLHNFSSMDQRGKNGIRILVCAEYENKIYNKVVLIQIRNDSQHYAQKAKNEIEKYMKNFINEKITNQSS